MGGGKERVALVAYRPGHSLGWPLSQAGGIGKWVGIEKMPC